MIVISQLKLPVEHKKEELDQMIKKILNIKNPFSYKIVKKSLDARKKEQLCYIYSVHLELPNEKEIIKRCRNKNVSLAEVTQYEFPKHGEKVMKHRPIVVGSGPAGLFCAWMLAKEGYKPILLERGEMVDKRKEKIEQYWKTGQLDTESNVQFGEGGAGTFSDGKLNTGVKDKWGRQKEILKLFVKHGAPEEILYWNKPHIGTDLLCHIIPNIRKEIIELGGDVRFQSKVTDLKLILYDGKENLVLSCTKEVEKDVIVAQKIGEMEAVCVNGEEWIPCETLVVAVGHSARDTFSMLYDKGLYMTKKSFAIGVRVEHPREMINDSQYGEENQGISLPTADYKLVHHSSNGRSVYSFCMCPGGYIVNSSSEDGGIVVNGMSNYKRNGENSNSAIVVNVTPEDFFTDDPLAGVEFQRKWERLAYECGGKSGSVPIQLLGDLKKGQISTNFGTIKPSLQGLYQFADLKQCLPSYVIDGIVEAMDAFDKKIKGYGREDTILMGVETRTSSPLRMERDDEFVSNIVGLYPCGEGAGYAGGITSAAIDGMKVAEAIGRLYCPMESKN